MIFNPGEPRQRWFYFLFCFGEKTSPQGETKRAEPLNVEFLVDVFLSYLAMGQNLFGTFSVGITTCLKGFLRVTGGFPGF